MWIDQIGKVAGLDVTDDAVNGATAILNALLEGKIISPSSTWRPPARMSQGQGARRDGVAAARQLRDVPTMDELGFLGIASVNWQGLSRRAVSHPTSFRLGMRQPRSDATLEASGGLRPGGCWDRGARLTGGICRRDQDRDGQMGKSEAEVLASGGTSSRHRVVLLAKDWREPRT